MKMPQEARTEEQKKLLTGVHIHPKVFEMVAMDRQRSVMVTMAGEQLIKLRYLATIKYSLHGFPVGTLAFSLTSTPGIRWRALLADVTTRSCGETRCRTLSLQYVASPSMW